MNTKKKPSRKDFEIAATELAEVADGWRKSGEAYRRDAPALYRVANWLDTL